MLSAESIRKAADYQKFDFTDDGRIDNVGQRMRKKLDALEDILPDFTGKSVLDIGCDFGFWSFLASERGASVTGLDRSRRVGSVGWVDIPALNNDAVGKYDIHSNCAFYGFEAGVQWHDLGKHDVVLLMSLYHHIFENTGGDHESIWYWLWRHTGQTLIWENPVDNRDRVVQMNVSPQLHDRYTEDQIKAVAGKYFEIEYEGPALHEPYRVVWKMVPKILIPRKYAGRVVSGAGGASKAFEYADGRRTEELWLKLGFKPYPGSLNIILDSDFDWDSQYYRGLLLDVANRSQGLDSEWIPKVMRFYPVMVDDLEAVALRFESDNYPLSMVEVISPVRLRDHLESEEIQLWQ